MRNISGVRAACWSVVLAVALATTAPAQTTNTNSAATSAPTANGIQGAERVGQLWDKPLVNTQGETVGTLSDIVVDLESGRVLYAIVTANTNLSGGNTVVVAPNKFQYGANGTNLVLNVTPSELASAPKWNASQAPNMGEVGFLNNVYQHWGESAWWGSGPSPTGRSYFHNVQAARELSGATVNSTDGSQLATVKTVVADIPSGRVLYVVLAGTSATGGNQELYPVPPMALTKGSSAKTLNTGLDAAKLQGAPHFSANSWPNLADTTYASQVYQYYGKQPYWQTGS